MSEDVSRGGAMAVGMSGHMSRNRARDLGMFRECLGMELGLEPCLRACPGTELGLETCVTWVMSRGRCG